MIDTHAHLNFSSFKDDLDEVMQEIMRLKMRVINVGSQFSTSQRAVELADKYPANLFAAIGLHPIHLFEMEFDELEMPFKTRREEFHAENYEKLSQHKNVVAIGEIGIDYFKQPSNVTIKEFKDKQKWTFLKQLQLAKKLNLPYILHCRGSKEAFEDAYKDALAVIRDFKYFHGVVHCFAANWEIARKFLDLGLLISFTGIITFPKTEFLGQVVKKIPLDRVMAETDAPFLAPQLVRGKRNEPRYVRYIIDKIADLKRITYEEAEEATTKNAESFFNLH
ncbi:MAG: TatD family hydrolase [Patescibacteria group bacterium]|jgi:TatD DNase family protein